MKIRIKSGSAVNSKGRDFPATEFSNIVTVTNGESTSLTPPKVTSVDSIESDGVFAVGDVIRIAVTFDAAVTVSGGIPRIKLNLTPGPAYATYTSGSGTNVLVFSYTVGASDELSSLDLADSSALELNGATISSASGDAVTKFTVPTWWFFRITGWKF